MCTAATSVRCGHYPAPSPLVAFVVLSFPSKDRAHLTTLVRSSRRKLPRCRLFCWQNPSLVHLTSADVPRAASFKVDGEVSERFCLCAGCSFMCATTIAPLVPLCWMSWCDTRCLVMFAHFYPRCFSPRPWSLQLRYQ